MQLEVENKTNHPITVNLSDYDKKTGRPLNERILVINLDTNEESDKFSKESWEMAKKRPYIQALLDNGKLVERLIALEKD